MSQISDVCSLEHESEYGDAGRSHDSSSLSRCNSSSSIVSSATQTEENTNASTSLETVWTDSKHSSYLDLMEANFVRNLYGKSYCVEDVFGRKCDLDLHHESPYAEVEECDDDSAQSTLHMPFETMEFKIYDRGDWTWRPFSRSMVTAGIPWALLKNPWVKHFRTKNSSTDGSNPIVSTSASLIKDTVGSLPKSSTSNSTAIQSASLSSRKDEASLEVSKTELSACGKGNGSETGVMKERLSIRNPVAGVANTGKRALWYAYNQVPVTRQKTGNEVKGGSLHGAFDQDDAAPTNGLVHLLPERLGNYVEEN